MDFGRVTQKSIGFLNELMIVFNQKKDKLCIGQRKPIAQLELVKITVKIRFVQVGLWLTMTYFMVVVIEYVRKLYSGRQQENHGQDQGKEFKPKMFSVACNQSIRCLNPNRFKIFFSNSQKNLNWPNSHPKARSRI